MSERYGRRDEPAFRSDQREGKVGRDGKVERQLKDAGGERDRMEG